MRRSIVKACMAGEAKPLFRHALQGKCLSDMPKDLPGLRTVQVYGFAIQSWLKVVGRVHFEQQHLQPELPREYSTQRRSKLTLRAETWSDASDHPTEGSIRFAKDFLRRHVHVRAHAV